MNSLLLLRSLIVASVLVDTAPAALAGWRLIDRTVLDPNAAQIAAVGVMPPLADLSGFVSIMPGAFRSRGSTKSVIPFLMVDGLAQDQPSSAQELWRHFAPGVGEVEVVAFAQAQADVRVGPLGRGLAIIYGQSTAEFLLDGAYGVAHVGLMVEGQSPAWG
ncbi:MAG: hypothetical protein KDB18_13260, partial [Salinibacterium sp.]|nr:hypothetical protein [Salinibacterium sp.]